MIKISYFQKGPISFSLTIVSLFLLLITIASCDNTNNTVQANVTRSNNNFDEKAFRLRLENAYSDFSLTMISSNVTITNIVIDNTASNQMIVLDFFVVEMNNLNETICPTAPYVVGLFETNQNLYMSYFTNLSVTNITFSATSCFNASGFAFIDIPLVEQQTTYARFDYIKGDDFLNNSTDSLELSIANPICNPPSPSEQFTICQIRYIGDCKVTLVFTHDEAESDDNVVEFFNQIDGRELSYAFGNTLFEKPEEFSRLTSTTPQTDSTPPQTTSSPDVSDSTPPQTTSSPDVSAVITTPIVIYVPVEIIPVWCWVVIIILAVLCFLLIIFIILLWCLFLRRKKIRLNETDQNQEVSSQDSKPIDSIVPPKPPSRTSSITLSTNVSNNLEENESSTKQEDIPPKSTVTFLHEPEVLSSPSSSTYSETDSQSESGQSVFDQLSHIVKKTNHPNKLPPLVSPPNPISDRKDHRGSYPFIAARGPDGIFMPKPHGKGWKPFPPRKIASHDENMNDSYFK